MTPQATAQVLSAAPDLIPASIEESNTVIKAHALEKGFMRAKKQVRALAGLHLNVGPRQVTGLIGPDGAGKTTFMRLCAGLLRPDAGKLQVLGLDTVQQTLEVQARI